MESRPRFLPTLFFLSIISYFSLAVPAATTDTTFPKEAQPTRSGFLPINSSSTSAMYFTYYDAQQPNSPLPNTPLLIWLQGGPGCSSMIGNLFEIGPWRVNSNVTIEPNPGAWNRLFGLLFIDNPIGAGFSIASTRQEIPRDQETVAKYLYVAIRSFIASNSSFQSRPVYITGESYAGKYIPSIGSYILQQNAGLPTSSQVNLRGVAIGNGMTHPVTQVTVHAAQAYYIGLINERQKNQLEQLQNEAVSFVQQGRWINATAARTRVLNRLTNMTGLATTFDFTRKRPYESNLVGRFIQKPGVKKAFGVAEDTRFVQCSPAVRAALREDVMKSVKFRVEELLNKSKVLLYQGLFDLRSGPASTESWIKELKWQGLENFLMANRSVWNVNGQVAGYVQTWGSLSEVVLSGAGHFAPHDQPVNSQAMIQDWVLGRGLFAQENEVSFEDI